MVFTHFLVSETPQKFDQSIKALCGAQVANPQPVVMVEVFERGMPSFSLRDCKKCINEIYGCAMTGERTYLYGIVEAQEAKNAQAESAA